MNYLDRILFASDFDAHDINTQTNQHAKVKDLRNPPNISQQVSAVSVNALPQLTREATTGHLRFWEGKHRIYRTLGRIGAVSTFACAASTYVMPSTAGAVGAVALAVLSGVSFCSEVRAQTQISQWGILQAEVAAPKVENCVPVSQTLLIQNRPPNVIIFNCQYGSGHKMATQGIRESLPDCKVHVVDVYNEPLKSLDPMKYINNKLSFEHFFNNLAKHERYSLLNFLGKVGTITLPAQRKKFEKLLLKFLIKEIQEDKPDILISCIPMINSALATLGKKLNIPVLVVTTDLDIANFAAGLTDEDCSVDKSKFRMTVAYDKNTWEPLLGQTLPAHVKNILQYQVGYPTRKAFSMPCDNDKLEELRRNYNIQPDENVAVVMMGGNTAAAAKSYAKHLLRMTPDQIQEIVGNGNPRNKIRLICLCGNIQEPNNKQLMDKLNGFNKSPKKTNNRVTIQGAPGTPQIAELVSLTELFTMISKPGGSTMGEMIKKRVPMVYHVGGEPLDWEKGNQHYGETNKLGKTFHMPKKITEQSKKELVNVLRQTLAWHHQIQSGSKKVPEADFDFTDNIRQTVREMIAK